MEEYLAARASVPRGTPAPSLPEVVDAVSNWFNAEYDAAVAKARASLPTAMPPALRAICQQIPCPDFQEVTAEVSPYLEITERASGNLWVRCLTCSTWLCPAGESDRALEHAEETHECPVMNR